MPKVKWDAQGYSDTLVPEPVCSLPLLSWCFPSTTARQNTGHSDKFEFQINYEFFLV